MERSPGEKGSLYALYKSVPAAEAEDLFEEWQWESAIEFGQQVLRDINHPDWVDNQPTFQLWPNLGEVNRFLH